MTDKTHWKLLTNPDYLGAYWLKPGEDATVVIEYVAREQITGAGGKHEDATVVHFKNDVKPWILNATNSKTIAKLYGPYVEDWAGKAITLFASTTKWQGDIVECLRVRPKVAERKKQPITAARFDAALKQIQAGQYTAEKLRAGFELTDEQEQSLSARLAEMAANVEPEVTE